MANESAVGDSTDAEQQRRAGGGAQILEQEEFASRRAVGRRICAEFDLHDHRGRPQVAGCLKVLRGLQQQGQPLVLLPAGRAPSCVGQPAPLAPDVALAASVPEHLAQVEGLEIELVRKRGERWMGWSDAQRRAYLECVVGLSRFLIRGGCTHLASHVLGRGLRRLPQDFEQRYGYPPWLVETFVQVEQAGTSLRAANFVYVGQTSERGRPDRAQLRAAGVKSIYMYELWAGWRRQWPAQPSRNPLQFNVWRRLRGSSSAALAALATVARGMLAAPQPCAAAPSPTVHSVAYWTGRCRPTYQLLPQTSLPAQSQDTLNETM